MHGCPRPPPAARHPPTPSSLFCVVGLLFVLFAGSRRSTPARTRRGGNSCAHFPPRRASRTGTAPAYAARHARPASTAHEWRPTSSASPPRTSPATSRPRRPPWSSPSLSASSTTAMPSSAWAWRCTTGLLLLVVVLLLLLLLLLTAAAAAVVVVMWAGMRRPHRSRRRRRRRRRLLRRRLSRCCTRRA